MTFLHRFLRDESGATAIEYSLIACFVVLVIIVAIQSVGQQLLPYFVSVAKGFS